MKRIAVLIVAMALSGCAELGELLMGDSYDEWYVEGPPVVYQVPPAAVLPPDAPVAQVTAVTPAGFSGTTQEPELAPRK